MAETLSIAPADLRIDEENPRISTPNAGQQKGSQCPSSPPRKETLSARSRHRASWNGPTSLLIVMPLLGSPTRYTVLEGNRRLAALRALENPESVAEAVPQAVLKALRKLSRQYQDNPIETTQCLVVKDRDTARHWIELRHTGLNEGAGLMPWGSDESTRYKSRSNREAHFQALDFLQQRGDISPELRRKVPATTLKRLLETPDVAHGSGSEMQKGTLALLADEGAVAKALMHVVNDLVGRQIRVGDVYTKPQRQSTRGIFLATS